MIAIATPLVLPGGITLPNRLAKAAMSEGLADAHGNATTAHATLYARWAKGGAGLILTGNVMVDHRYLEAPGNIVIEPGTGRRAREALSQLAQAAKSHGAAVFLQISHAGRQTPKHISDRPVAPSAVALDMPGRTLHPFAPPRALTGEEVEDIIVRFAHAARVARETGFDGVQIHAAHGYLVSQFLSPLANRRRDAWGGTPDNRARFLMQVLQACRTAAGADFPLAVKLNASDFQKGGFSPQDSLAVVDRLSAFGLALLEISGGSYEQPQMMGLDGKAAPEEASRLAASTKAREAYFLDHAKSVRARTTLPLMVTGGFRSRAAMEAALTGRQCDLIGLARPLCVVPDGPALLLSGQADALPDFERRLRLWPGLSPRPRSTLLRTLTGWGQQAFFLRQIDCMGQGRPPRPGLGLFASLVWMQARMRAIGKRRLAVLEPAQKGRKPPRSSRLRQD